MCHVSCAQVRAVQHAALGCPAHAAAAPSAGAEVAAHVSGVAADAAGAPAGAAHVDSSPAGRCAGAGAPAPGPARSSVPAAVAGTVAGAGAAELVVLGRVGVHLVRHLCSPALVLHVLQLRWQPASHN